MRLALLAAFPFPAPQGSQWFAAEQARALQAAGTDVTLFCYGTSDGRPHDDLEVVRVPAEISPKRFRAGFDSAKWGADRALARNLVDAHRAAPFDAVLAHNAEAGLVAIAVRRQLRIPVLYVAHTLWREELGSYLPRAVGRPSRWVGSLLDAFLAFRADAILTLSEVARSELARFARGPVERIVPGLHPGRVPDRDDVSAVCFRHGLSPDGYVVYAGNLDAYQDLPDLDAAARDGGGMPVVAVTHDAKGASLPSLELLQVATPEEARLLIYGARAAVVPRRHTGGFPIKLLQYMEAARPIVAMARVADTLEHEESGWLLPDDASPDTLAAALRRCSQDEALRSRLGAGARKVLENEHSWPELAEATLRLTTRVIEAHRR